MEEAIGPALDATRILGQRTGELHVALASRSDDPIFAPEPFTTLYQRSLYQAIRSQIRQTYVQLRRLCGTLSPDLRVAAEQLLGREEELIQHVRRVYAERITAWRIRVHGDYNLREVLYDGRDFTVVDFEGEATRPISDRRRKYTPLRDVAGMLRLVSLRRSALVARWHRFAMKTGPALQPWSRFWQVWSSAAFLPLVSRRHAATPVRFLPACRRGTGYASRLLSGKTGGRRIAGGTGSPRRLPTRGSGGDSRVAVPVEGLLQLLDASSGPERPVP